MQLIGTTTLNTIADTIETYSLLERGKRAVLALSGGKDFIFSMLALRELGFDFVPVTVDMGYEKHWAARIASTANGLGFPIHVIDVRRPALRSSLKEQEIVDIQSRLVTLDSLEIAKDRNITPCTQCYNIKFITLKSFAEAHQIDTIIFAHHATDAVASLLKSAFMYIDRWDNNNEIYSGIRFAHFVDEAQKYFVHGYNNFVNSWIYSRAQQLTQSHSASTDEPPKQYVDALQGQMKIVRPLFGIFEGMIRDYIQNNEIVVEGSGCGHGLTKETQTPREMIHRRILDALSENEQASDVENLLLNLTKISLQDDGTLTVNARNQRAHILGSNYKTDKIGGVKL